MRILSSTLLAAQKQATHVPYVKVKATNQKMGVVRLDWTRLYSGSEAEGPHAITIPGDGSLVRVKVTPVEDSRKLYRQRVASPGPSSDFSQWVYTGHYSVLAVALCSLGAEVSLFWIDADYELQRQKSINYGTTWSSPELIDYTTSTAVYGMAAAYKPGGDLAVFFTDQNTLFVKQYTGGEWQDKIGWDKTTGDLSGVAAVYDHDWNLLLTGRDVNDNPKLWSLIYGNGGDVSPGSWSALKELAAAPAGGDFEYSAPFLDKPDTFRSFYMEKFSGNESYNRPYRTYSVPDTSFLNGLWYEPVPFNQVSEYGLAITHSANYSWLTCPSGVWRAPLAIQSLDLTVDIIGVKEELNEMSGKLAVELDNSTGKYASPGSGTLTLLQTGCQIDFSPGYRTPAGNEISSGLTFTLEAYEHTSSSGKAGLILKACDGWAALHNWKAHYQFRWNKETSEMSVKQILEFILARVGLKLEVKSSSSAITDFYPDFTIHAGNSGAEIIKRLLTFVPDIIFIEGYKAYLINPQSTDTPIYSYGTDHSIFEGKYYRGALELNRIQIEGRDADTDSQILVDSFGWDEIDRIDERWQQLSDRNIGTVTQAQERGLAYFREAEIHTANGYMRMPVNCGQQVYDVIEVTDIRTGLSAEPRRVLAISLLYNPQCGEYEQRLLLGGV
jgi:hypothetical protein